MKLTVTETALPGVVIVQPECFPDPRGFFFETWNARDFAAAGLDLGFVQDSHSRSSRGVLRGLHYQDASAPLAKLVRCTAGAIFDVAVDIRFGSATFGQWVGVELSAENKRQLVVPEGFAHGFQVVSEIAEVQYKQTGYWNPAVEGSILWNDTDIGVNWPLPGPILSPRDERGVPLAAYAKNPAFRSA